MLHSCPRVQAFEPGPLILHVDPDSPAPLNGQTWDTAYHRLEDAIFAAPAGVEIRVAEGVYRPDGGTNDRAASFQLKSNLSIYGGYAGFGAGNPDARDPDNYECILSGDIGLANDNTDNSFHVVTTVSGVSNSILNGFTITFGHADGPGTFDRGGGLYVASGTPTIESCVFNFNFAGQGGALDVGASAAPVFLQCVFADNASSGNGGAVSTFFANPSFVACSFAGNNAEVSGGAASFFGGSPIVAACQFVDNASLIFGGAVYESFGQLSLGDCLFDGNFVVNSLAVSSDGGAAFHNDSGDVLFYACNFTDNLTSDDGGAIFQRDGSMQLERCVMRNNFAGERGGAIYSTNSSIEIRTCSILGNSATQNGGALCNVNGPVTMLRSTIVNNRATLLGGGIHSTGVTVSLNSNIFWGNLDAMGTNENSQLRLASGSAVFDFCCVMGWTGAHPGGGNIAGPPMMVDADGPDNIAGTADDNVRLKPTSLCINGGDPSNAPPPSEPADLDGLPRIMGCVVDIGAYEFYTGIAHSGDLDGNGAVNGLDASLFTNAMLGIGPPAFFCVADINADSSVDFLDLDLFLGLALAP